MSAEAEIPTGPHVYQAICTVQAELAKTGIAKTSENTQQKYKFRGIDAVYAALSPLLAQHKLVVVPRITERICVERISQTGNPLFNVTVRAEFDFISALDGTTHTAMTFGEAMDSADKATNKAMSAAYKYAAFMTFAIPTEGDNDADADTHQVAREKVSGITKIKERLSALMRDGNAATSRADLQALIDQHRTDLETIKNANHEWWTGDGEDFEGFSKWIARRRSELPPSMETEQGPFQPQTLTYQLLISTLNECTSTQDLQSWLNKNGQIVENDLDENERASFEAIYDQKAEALKLLDTTTVGG